MKSPTFTPTLAPAAEGWQVWLSEGEGATTPSFEQAAALIPRGSDVHLLLPSSLLVIERLRLPAADRAELDGMVRLQWEKTLPYSAEELVGDFVDLGRDGADSVVLSFATAWPGLEGLRKGLRTQGLRPVRVTPYLSQVADACPPGQSVLAIHGEEGSWLASVIVDRQVAWAHSLNGVTVESVAAELPHLLLAASLEGVAVENLTLGLAPEAAAFAADLARVLELPVILLAWPRTLLAGGANLLPEAWKAEQLREHLGRRWRQRLAVGAAIWLALIAGGWAHLLILQRHNRQLEAETAALAPRLNLQQSRQARAETLRNAIDPERYSLEILRILFEQMRGDRLQLTEYDQSLDQWRITGEAPSASLAAEYVARLKQHPGLRAWQITSAPPQLLVNERAQFNITAKP